MASNDFRFFFAIFGQQTDFLLPTAYSRLSTLDIRTVRSAAATFAVVVYRKRCMYECYILYWTNTLNISFLVVDFAAVFSMHQLYTNLAEQLIFALKTGQQKEKLFLIKYLVLFAHLHAVWLAKKFFDTDTLILISIKIILCTVWVCSCKTNVWE